VIDIHTHLLPGVDDGAPSVEVAAPILERFAKDGVTVVICTPHLLASEAARAPVEHHARLLERLAASVPRGPELKQGWEIMLDAPGVDLRAPELHLGGSSAVLVEFARMHVPPGAARELLRIRESGVVPVLAHPERYHGCDLADVVEWRDAGAVIQMDAVTLFGSAPPSRIARAMLQAALVDCIASDNHGDGRSLAAARQWLVEIGAVEQAQLLTHTNAGRLLLNEPVLPVAPIPEVEQGMLARLKELFLRRR
jgi:protein-tyrosine phosphatase